MASASTALEIFDGAYKPIQNFNNTMSLGITDITNTLNLGITDISNTLNLGLTKVTNTLNNTVNNFNTTVNQTSNTFQTLVYVQNEVIKGEEEITAKIEGAKDAHDDFNNSVQQSGSKISSFLKSINLQSVIGTLKSAKSFSDEYVDTFSRLDSINDNLQTTKQLQDKVFASAQRSGGSYLAIADNIGKMGQTALSAFKSNDELIAFHELMQKSFKIGGVNPEDQQAAMDQVTSIMDSGKMDKGDFSALLDTAPQIIDSLANYTGKSKSELMNLASDGAISADMLKNSMFAASGDIDNQFSQMPKTVGEYFNNLKNSAVQSLDPIITGVNNLFNSDAAQLIGQYSTMIGKLWAMIAPVMAQAGAWMLANWPIMLIILAVAALVGALIYFGTSVEQIVGFVTGVFFALYAYIYNIVAFLYNLFASFVEFLANLFFDPIYAVKKLIYDLAMTFGGYMYNMLRSAEDFAGGFMKVILAGINGALKGFNWLVEKVNQIFGTDFSTAKLFDENNIHAVSDSVKGMLDKLEEPVSNKDVVKISRMEYKNVSDSFNSGNELGSKAYSDTIGAVKGGLDSIFKTPEQGPQFNPDPYESIGFNSTSAGSNPASNISNVGKVDQVGKINDTVDISSEDLKMMRELAEMKSIQNFVSLTPTVQVSTGPVTNGADIETIVGRIEQVLEEEITSSAAGVYA